MTTTRFVLVRHGEAQGNREFRYLGTSDVPLTARGEQQARQLAQDLARFPLDAIFTSPLARARATAAAIGEVTGIEPSTLEDLREQGYGAWEGLTHEEARALDAAALAAWEADASVAPPSGESLVQMQARVLTAVDDLAARHPDEMVALVSHVGPIKMLICAALGLPPSGARRMWLDPASYSVIDWRLKDAGASTGLLRIFNASAHLDPPACWLATPKSSM
jgi:ribonuclease H / adenosylcobalamin/alpha-ribazole phosphatase